MYIQYFYTINIKKKEKKIVLFFLTFLLILLILILILILIIKIIIYIIYNFYQQRIGNEGKFWNIYIYNYINY